MINDLDRIKDEIREYLTQQGFITFHAFPRAARTNTVHWNTTTHPDFREFLETARQTGTKIIVLAPHVFEDHHVDDAIESLESFEMPRDDHRVYERRLRDLKGFEGFTCEIELSYEYGMATYVYTLRTDWFLEFLRVMEEINGFLDDESEEDESGIGGYFSRN